MPIETICQGCSKKLRVADEHAGKQARCPGCGNIYIVPQPTPSSYSPLESPLGSSPLPSTSAKPTPAITPTTPAESSPFSFTDSASSASPTFSAAPVFANPPAKDVSDRWFMKIDDGREFGPVDRATLDQWYRERRIGTTTKLKRELDSQWQPASSIFPALVGAATSVAATNYAANPFAEQPAYSTPNPYAPTGMRANAQGYVEPHRGGLILAFSLIGWFVCVFFGIAAWTMAAGDLRKMRAGQMDNAGYGLTQAGMIISIIQVVMFGLSIAFVLLLMLIGAANG